MQSSASVLTVHRGVDGPTLPGHTGLVLVRDLNAKLQLVERLNAAVDGVRRFKQRQRGLMGGQLLVCLAESILAGGSHLAHPDPLREDKAGRVLRRWQGCRRQRLSASCCRGIRRGGGGVDGGDKWGCSGGIVW